MNKFVAFLLLAAVMVANGWHLAILQAYAWSDMYQEFSQSLDAEEALNKTFSGKAPCSNCEIVLKLQKVPKANDAWENWAENKTVLIISLQKPTHTIQPSNFNQLLDTEFSFKTRTQSPESPPPRC